MKNELRTFFALYFINVIFSKFTFFTFIQGPHYNFHTSYRWLSSSVFPHHNCIKPYQGLFLNDLPIVYFRYTILHYFPKFKGGPRVM